MSNSESEQVPKTQTGPSGGPPKPPTKTVGGLEDGPSRDPRHRDIADRLLHELSVKLSSPGLSVAEKAKVTKTIEQLKSRIREDT